MQGTAGGHADASACVQSLQCSSNWIIVSDHQHGEEAMPAVHLKYAGYSNSNSIKHYVVFRTHSLTSQSAVGPQGPNAVILSRLVQAGSAMPIGESVSVMSAGCTARQQCSAGLVHLVGVVLVPCTLAVAECPTSAAACIAL
jgi:hypothetical protein